jgi:hypothetical protein
MKVINHVALLEHYEKAKELHKKDRLVRAERWANQQEKNSFRASSYPEWMSETGKEFLDDCWDGLNRYML